MRMIALLALVSVLWLATTHAEACPPSGQVQAYQLVQVQPPAQVQPYSQPYAVQGCGQAQAMYAGPAVYAQVEVGGGFRDRLKSRCGPLRRLRGKC
jgi:hypothetical protein